MGGGGRYPSTPTRMSIVRKSSKFWPPYPSEDMEKLESKHTTGGI